MNTTDTLKQALSTLLSDTISGNPHTCAQQAHLMEALKAAWDLKGHAQLIHDSYIQWRDLAKMRQLLDTFIDIKELRIGITLFRDSNNSAFRVQRVLDIFRIANQQNNLQPVHHDHPLFELFSHMSRIARSPLFELVNKSVSSQRATIHGILTIDLQTMRHLIEQHGTPSQWLNTLHFQES